MDQKNQGKVQELEVMMQTAENAIKIKITIFCWEI